METAFTTQSASTPQSIRLSGRWLMAARIAWWMLAGYPTLLFLLGLVPAFELLRIPCDPTACNKDNFFVLLPEQAQALAARGFSLNDYAAYINGLHLFQAISLAGCGLLIFLRRSDETIALLTSLALVVLGVYLIPGTASAAFLAFPWLRPLGIITYIWGNWIFPALLFLLPDGRFVPRWGRLFFVLWGGYATYGTLTYNPTTSSPDDLTSRVGTLILLASAAAGVYGQIYRYRRVATLLQRQQIKWIGLGLAGIALSACVIAFSNPSPMGAGATPIEVRLLAFTFSTLGFSFFPIALTFAILRHHLWEIDLVLNRAFVYGGLTAAIMALYALIVGGLSALFHAQGNAVIGYLGAICVALLFQPLRERLQRGVNRLMFGQRDEPYMVLARFGRQLEITPTSATLLPTITATIKDTLKLPMVDIEVNNSTGALRDDHAQRSVSRSTEHSLPRNVPEGLMTFPLFYQNEPVGRLTVAPREGETTLSATDRRLLEDLARQAGVAVHAARVTAELQQARERLVTAREEERRRLRRDLHDGLGPTLAALTAQAEAARDLVPIHPEQSIVLLTDMAVQAQAATADIRRLVYNLRPPALDDLGLVCAIQAQAQRAYQTSGLTVRVQAGAIPPLPAAVEVAVYRIVQEALANVVRHAGAQECWVAIDITGERLSVAIVDDGRGLPPTVEAGVGLTSMRERAEELGGTWRLTANNPGTRVTAHLPLTQLADRAREQPAD
jgi:signal transduction histidine kinase